MKKLIVIRYVLYGSKEVIKVPLHYEITQEGNTEICHCKVDLPENAILEWLTVEEFSIPTVYEPGSPGVTITSFSEIRGIKNIDTALFIGEVNRQIWVAERWNDRF